VRLWCALPGILLLTSLDYSQSGRRPAEIKVPTSTSEQQVKQAKPVTAEPVPRDAERNQDYRCTEDGSLARIDSEDAAETVVSTKDADLLASITAKPRPSYTKEARRKGVQGFVVLRVLLSARNKISRVRVVKGLPSGLTENAIRAACKMEFKPAMKNGEAVSVWLVAEYVFRLADSSIFTP
jgi:TonB family protein